MVGIIKDIHPLVLDTIIVSIFVLIIFFGVLKGIKKTSIDFLIFIVAFFLGFCSFTKEVKGALVTSLNIIGLAPAGSDAAYKMAISIFSNFVASIVLFLLFFAIFHSIKYLICLLTRRGKKEGTPRKSKVGRVFAGLVSLLYGGATLVLILLFTNNNLVGMNGPIEKSTVTKFVVNSAEKLLNRQEKNAKNKLAIKALKGDILYKVDDDLLESYIYIENKAETLLMDKEYVEILSASGLSDVETSDLIKERIEDLNQLATFVNNFDDFVVCKKEFAKVGEAWLTIMNRVAKDKQLDKIEFAINESGAMKANFRKAGLDDKIILLYEEIIIEK